MYKYLLFILAFPFAAQASLKVMSFNTMCSTCGDKENYGTYKQRLVGIADTINRHSPDLLSLQEFTFKHEVNQVLKNVKKKYKAIYFNGITTNFFDPVLLIDPARFDIVREDSVWLGPNTNSPKGWKVTLPRRFQWVELYDKVKKENFIFAGTHFDNSTDNKTPSAKYVNHFLSQFKVPVIFAGDTNLKTSMEGYQFLLQDVFNDTFPGTENVNLISNGPHTIHDSCNIHKSPTFPDCRIDHVLTSKDSSWKVKSWSVDVFKYNGKMGFVSDHRAVIVELE